MIKSPIDKGLEFSFIMKNNLYIINTNFTDHWQQPLGFF